MSSPDPTTSLVVAVDFTFNTSTKEATFSVDPKVGDLAYGGQDWITWSLIPTDQNGNTITATFPYEKGIYFKKGTGPFSDWTGNPPWFAETVQPPGTAYQVQVDNTGHGKGKLRFQYGMSVIYNGQTYNYDPEVDEEGEDGGYTRPGKPKRK